MSSDFVPGRRAVLKGTALLALGAAAPGSVAAASGEALRPEALNRLQRAMESLVADAYMPGAAWLVHRGGEAHAGTAGTHRLGGKGPQIRRDTIFRVASLSKPVTAALAMMLVEDGRLTLDGPVDELLPELADRRVLRAIDGPLDDTVPAEQPVTLRQLLTMTFGLGAVMVFPDKYPIQAAMREAGIAPSWVLPKMGADEYMARLGALPLAAQPGEMFLYNNGLDVAGILIERAAGRRLSQVMQERLFEPLGMRDTGFHVPGDKHGRLPPQYGPDMAAGDGTLRQFGAGDGIDFSAPPPLDSGAGGLVSTVDDYRRFLRMMLNDGELDGIRFLEPASVAEMTRDQLTPRQKTGPHAEPFMAGGGAGWGLGMSVAVARTSPWLTPGRFGWDGGYGTTAYADPEEDLIGVFFSQRMMTSPQPPRSYVEFWTRVYEAV